MVIFGGLASESSSSTQLMFEVVKRDIKRIVLTSSSPVEDEVISEFDSERVRLLDRSVPIVRSSNDTKLEDAIPDPVLNSFPLERFRERIESINLTLGGVRGRSQSEAVVAEVYVSPDDRLGREGV